MKKYIAQFTIGLAVCLACFASIAIAQQSTIIVEQTVKVKAVLPAEVNSALMAQAHIQSGNITAQGDNLVISGMATIIVPKAQMGAIVNLNTGKTNALNPNNFIRGTFTLGTNGTAVIADFKK